MASPDEIGSESVDAVIWAEEALGFQFPDRWPDKRTLYVRTTTSNSPGPALYRPRLPVLRGAITPDQLTIFSDRPEAAITALAEWLEGVRNPLNQPELIQKLEVILGDVRVALEDPPNVDREELAQLQSAADTLDAQIKAPRKSRRVIAWALRQVTAFPVNVLGNIAADYAFELLHHVGH